VHIKKQALFDDILNRNNKYHQSLAIEKRIWMAGGGEGEGSDEESARRFKREDLLSWYKVWNQT
jgi:hypothetical protein